MTTMSGLTDHTIVVCGGGGGIGAASAIRLAREGARVVVGDVNSTGAKETVETNTAGGGTSPTTPRWQR
jgi:NAD(P)-dependent dehydrogenase (short-subunit alcohol dehydrogenase family)